MTIPFSPNTGDIRKYTVTCDYRTKPDAKIAVACKAAKEGVLELMRFQGATPPPGYISILDARRDALNSFTAPKQIKRERDAEDINGGQDRWKRRRQSSRGNANDVPYIKGEIPYVPRMTHALPTRPASMASDDWNGSTNFSNKGIWRNPLGPTPSEVTVPSTPAQADTVMGQPNSEAQAVGDSSTSQVQVPTILPPISMSAPPPPATVGQPYIYLPDGRLGYGVGHAVAPYQLAPPPPPQVYPGGYYTPLPPHPMNPGIQSAFPGGPAVYPTTQYVIAQQNPPYMSYGTVAAQHPYAAYAALSTYPPQYPGYPPNTQVIYAAGPSATPGMPGGQPGVVYHTMPPAQEYPQAQGPFVVPQGLPPQNTISHEGVISSNGTNEQEPIKVEDSPSPEPTPVRPAKLGLKERKARQEPPGTSLILI